MFSQRVAAVETNPAHMPCGCSVAANSPVPGKVDKVAAEAAVRALLVAIGEDPSREGIADTPARVAKLWAEFIDYEPGKLGTQFEAVNADQMIVVSGMRVWSMCEHHLLPFWCDVSVAYIAQGTVLGLSKMGRIAHKHGHRLQLQERVVAGIADEMAELLGHEDVAVIATGEHLCMTMRGIKTPARMTSSSVKGKFRIPEVKAEFLSLAKA